MKRANKKDKCVSCQNWTGSTEQQSDGIVNKTQPVHTHAVSETLVWASFKCVMNLHWEKNIHT